MAVSNLLLCLTSHVLTNIDTHSRADVGPGDGMGNDLVPVSCHHSAR